MRKVALGFIGETEVSEMYSPLFSAISPLPARQYTAVLFGNQMARRPDDFDLGTNFGVGYVDLAEFHRNLTKPLEKGILVAQATVQKKSGPMQVEIRLSYTGAGTEVFALYDPAKPDEAIGKITLTPVLEKGKRMSVEYPVPYIFIGRMDNFKQDEYKGVGTCLLQIAIERSLKCARGRVALSALSQSLAFYFLLGFRYVEGRNQQAPGVLDALLDAYIDAQQKEGKTKIFAPRERFPQAYMYLPEEAFTRWQSIIDDSPILPDELPH